MEGGRWAHWLLPRQPSIPRAPGNDLFNPPHELAVLEIGEGKLREVKGLPRSYNSEGDKGRLHLLTCYGHLRCIEVP